MRRKPWDGQREYDKEHIKKVGVSLKTELAKEFADVCKKNGVSMNSILKDTIEQYIKDNSSISKRNAKMNKVVLELKKDVTNGVFYRYSIGDFKFWFVQLDNGNIYNVNIADYSGKYKDFELYIDIDDNLYYPNAFGVRTHTKKQNVAEAKKHIKDMEYICSVLLDIEKFFKENFCSEMSGLHD